MANELQLERLLEDSKEGMSNRWNNWRKYHPERKLDLSGADLQKCDLRSFNLTNADLRGAKLQEANLLGAILAEADLSEANLSGAVLTKSNLTRAILRNAILNGANLVGADLSRANLQQASLQFAKLTHSNLRLANLHQANLNEADIAEANLFGADLREAILDNADFYKAIIINTILDRDDDSDQNQIINIAKADPANIQEVGASLFALSGDYYKNVLRQSRNSFLIASILAIFGTGLIIVAIIFFLIQKPSDLSYVSLAGGITVETIAGLVFYLYGKASQQLAAFQIPLDRIGRYQLANSVCENIEGNLQHATRAKLVEIIANGSLTEPLLEEKQDDKYFKEK